MTGLGILLAIKAPVVPWAIESMLFDDIIESMWPVVIEWGILRIYSFGILLMLAVLVGLFVSWKKGKELHFEEKHFLDVAVGMLFWGLVAGRLVYIGMNFEEFGWNILRWIWLTRYVGISFWAGLVGMAGAMYWYAKEANVDWFKWMDVMALGLSLGMVLVKIGMFIVGTGGWPFLPLIQAIFLLGLFVWLWWLEDEYRTIGWYRAGKSSAQPGFLWGWFLVWMGSIQAVTEGINGAPGWWWGGAAMAVGGFILYHRSGRNLKNDLLDFKKKIKVG